MLCLRSVCTCRQYVKYKSGHLIVHGDPNGFGIQLLNQLFGLSVISVGQCANVATRRASASVGILDVYYASGTPFATVCVMPARAYSYFRTVHPVCVCVCV